MPGLVQRRVQVVLGAPSGWFQLALLGADADAKLNLADVEERRVMRSRIGRERHRDVPAPGRGQEDGDRLGTVVALDADDPARPESGQPRSPFMHAVGKLAVAVGAVRHRDGEVVATGLHLVDQKLDHPMPPKYTIWPVTIALSGRRKKSMTLVTSSGSAQRGTACRAIRRSIRSAGTLSVSCVCTGLGPTALQVTPNGAASRATIRVNVSTALFEAA